MSIDISTMKRSTTNGYDADDQADQSILASAKPLALKAHSPLCRSKLLQEADSSSWHSGSGSNAEAD